MEGGTTGRCRLDTIKPEVSETQRVDERINRANRIVLLDPIIEALWQKLDWLRSAPSTNRFMITPAESRGES